MANALISEEDQASKLKTMQLCQHMIWVNFCSKLAMILRKCWSTHGHVVLAFYISVFRLSSGLSSVRYATPSPISKIRSLRYQVSDLQRTRKVLGGSPLSSMSEVFTWGIGRTWSHICGTAMVSQEASSMTLTVGAYLGKRPSIIQSIYSHQTISPKNESRTLWLRSWCVILSSWFVKKWFNHSHVHLSKHFPPFSGNK